MTINQMEYFSTVCTYHNITTSAKLLFISQPALSAALADLEKEVGCKLLNRSSKGVSPTPAGERLLGHFNNILSRYRLMENELPEIVHCENMVNIGFRPYLGEVEMMRIYSEFCKENADIEVALHEMRNNRPYLFLDEGQLDVLAVSERSMPGGWQEKYEYVRLNEKNMMLLYCHCMNPLAQKDGLELEDLAGQTVAFWEGHMEMRDRLKTAMSAKGLAVKTIVLPQMSGIANLICNNVAVGLLRGEYVDHINILHGCTLKESLWPIFRQPHVDTYMIWKKETERYLVKKHFIDFVRRYAAEQ